jgi:hypothetical protein
MKKAFGTIRIWNFNGNKRKNASLTNLHKQMTTFFKKLSKLDYVIVTYSIEKDKFRKKYHIHYLIEYTNKKTFYNLLAKLVDGEWTIGIGKGGTYDECIGKFGTVYLERSRIEREAYDYMNKHINANSKTLVKYQRIDDRVCMNELQKIYGVTKKTIDSWIENYSLPVISMSSHKKYIIRKDLLEWEDKLKASIKKAV